MQIDNKNTHPTQDTPVVRHAPSRGEKDKRTKIVDSSFEWGTAIIRAIIVIIVFTLTLIYVVTPISVSGISMEPTLHTGNIMLVYKWPQTWARLTGSQYIPARTNIVIVAKNSVSEEQLIKRVIALPREQVNIANNNLTVYNQDRPQGFNPDNAPCCKNLLEPTGTFWTIVPNGQIFAMGDNRNPGASIDSRSSIGNIKSSQIVGKVIMRVYPFNQIKIF
ncbi:MAG TPA: signal peptidase I [Candidatus Dormibacteraeota bacterium]|nr:signal peptidase I [Candidatus Dormibacteraeota bacterium]